jgi:hypothetical protein
LTADHHERHDSNISRLIGYVLRRYLEETLVKIPATS